MRSLLALLAFLFAAPAWAQTDTTTSQLNLLLMANGLHLSDWGTQTNTNLQKLEAAISSAYTVNTTGGTTTLTQAQAAVPVLVVAGALTSNATIVIPTNITKNWVILNETSGAYTVTVQSGAGTTLALLAGANQFYNDSVNILSSIQTNYEPPIPVGTILNYAGPTPPSSKWHFCDGSALSTTTYAALYTAIGGYYGTGSGTFNLPDTRGRVMASPDGGTGRLNSWTLGTGGGESAHTLSAAEMPVHNHGVNDPGHTHNVTDPGHTHTLGSRSIYSSNPSGNYAGGSVGSGLWTSPTTDLAYTGISIQGAYTGITTQNAGSGAAHNVVQPTLVVNCMIRIIP